MYAAYTVDAVYFSNYFTLLQWAVELLRKMLDGRKALLPQI